MTGSDLLLIVAMALAVFLPKALPLLLVSERATNRLRGWLPYVAPAVLSALVAPSILAPGGRLGTLSFSQLGYAAALLVALVSRQVVVSVAVGFGVVVLVAVLGG